MGFFHNWSVSFFCNNQLFRWKYFFRGFVLFLLLSGDVTAQSCPPNIDFEYGDFSNWTCYTGSVAAIGTQNVISLSPSGGPAVGQHTMFDRLVNSGQTDAYGGFSVMCPNGSRYSMKLGNTSGGAQAEGVSYEFTIPAGQNTYSLLYYYAVVLQNPNHHEYEQPRLELEVTNVSDNQVIECSSFTFAAYGSPLPGFFVSPVDDSVWCKAWTPVSINLNNKAGKTIRLFFKTADCTFKRHFGYAYIDVNSGCSGEFTGASYCADDTAVNVIAPYGYESYRWFNSDFTQVLGNQQTLSLRPPPASGTLLGVELTPYNGYGCKDTLFARLVDTLKLKANAGRDTVICGESGGAVLLGENPQAGVVYSWSPPSGLSDATVSNPMAQPTSPTNYVLTVRSTGGGCRNSDTVFVNKSAVDTTLLLLGKNEFCSTSNDSAVLVLPTANTVQWYLNGTSVSVLNPNWYKVTKSGTYYATLTNSEGCKLSTRSEIINIEQPVPGISYPLKYSLQNMDVQLQARTFGISTLWAPSTYLSNAAIVNPVFNRPDEGSQKYLITIDTKAGCRTVDTQVVNTIKEVKVYVPNAFTPNNDGLNDNFYPVTIGIKEIYAFKVFNRYGQEVYSMNSDSSEYWDGTFKGIQQDPGNFVWYFKGVGIDDKVYFQKGNVLLIR